VQGKVTIDYCLLGCHRLIVPQTVSPFSLPAKVKAKNISSAMNTVIVILHFPFFKYNSSILGFIKAALRSRCGHYIFILWLLLFFILVLLFSSPNLSRRTLDVYTILPHMV